jgi:ArsR family transcriptional regulator
MQEQTPDLLQHFEALASDKRLQILEWLRDPVAHFRPQAGGDLVRDGVCGLLIAEKLNISQSTTSRHMKQLIDSGLVRGKRIKQWTFYQRDEAAIQQMKQLIKSAM